MITWQMTTLISCGVGALVWFVMNKFAGGSAADPAVAQSKTDALSASKDLHATGLSIFSPILDAVHMDNPDMIVKEAQILKRFMDSPGGLLSHLREFVVAQIQQFLASPTEQQTVISLVATVFKIDPAVLTAILNLFRKNPAATSDQVAAAMKAAGPTP